MTMTINYDNKSKQPLLDEYSIIRSKNIRKCLRNEDHPADYRERVKVLESINRYYGYLRDAENNSPGIDIHGCFAVRLAFFLIDVVSAKKNRLTAQGHFRKNFYRDCMKQAAESGLADEIKDDGLLIIYIKQCLHLLTVSGILRRKGTAAVLDRSAISRGTLFHRLFNAFWDLARWEDIFPSDTESARELKISRHILKDMVLRHHGAVSLNRVANDFFDMTGFSAPNDLLSISFLDFYFFTWLRHFGMIRYSNGPEYAPVRITVTNAGRMYLSSI
jgi:hypothetical protein